MFIADLSHSEFSLSVYGDIDPAFIMQGTGIRSRRNTVGVAVEHQACGAGPVGDDQMFVNMKRLQYDFRHGVRVTVALIVGEKRIRR